MNEGAKSLETQRGERERREAEAIDEELARVCGTINMAAARQVELIRQALDNGSYAISGVRSAEPVGGVEVRSVARPRPGVICRHAPAHNDAEAPGAVALRLRPAGQARGRPRARRRTRP